MNFDSVGKVHELNNMNRNVLDRMSDFDFDELFTELTEKHKSRWLNPFNHLMLREYESNFIEWKISEDQTDKVSSAIESIIDKKKGENHHKRDGAKEEKRWKTGKESEFVIENYTGFRFVDLDAYDDSITAAGPDLIGRVGVKSSSFNNFPVIKRDGKQKTPEIIVVKYSDTLFKIAGIFTPDILNTYTSDKLVKMKTMLPRKTAFYHYGKGIKFAPGRESLSMLLYDLGY